jgi:putative sterol carrier protein
MTGDPLLGEAAASGMSDPTSAFFDDLKHREYEPLLAHKKGSVRIDLSDNGQVEHWFVAFDDGRIDVSRRIRRADATLHSDKALFDKVAQGKANAVAAVMRGAVGLEGDWNKLILFQRLFPSPP